MTGKEIIKYFESWAPKEIAWQRDNVGLQVGSMGRQVNNILLCLELTPGVLNEAIEKNCNFIFSHHPLLFNPLKKIDLEKDNNSLLVEKLIKNNITLYSAHTNLDFTKDGVSFQLAKTLELRNIDFLVKLKSNQYKLVVFIPGENVDEVSNAIFEAGGGKIGEYKKCSFRTEGKGTFLGSENTNPAAGEKGKLEKVNEIKLEVLVDSWKLNKVLTAMIKAHPYEEVAYDLLPLHNENINYGSGAIGELETPMSVDDFLSHISKKLNAKNFRYTSGKSKEIKKVAMCGGSGSEFISDAVKQQADAFITADLKYHTFHDYSGKILLIDAGHYETEIHSLNEVQQRLTNFINSKGYDVKIFKYSGSTNPIIFYNN